MRYLFEIGEKIYKKDRDEFYQHKLRAFDQFKDMNIKLVNGVDDIGEYFVIELVDKPCCETLLEAKFRALKFLKERCLRMELHAVFVYEPDLTTKNKLYQKAYRFDFNKFYALMVANEIAPDPEIDYVIDKFVKRSLKIKDFYNRKKKEIFACESVDNVNAIDYSELSILHGMSH